MKTTTSDKPEKVTIALRLLYISLGITFFAGLIQAFQAPKSLMLFTIASPLISIVLLWFLIYMIGKGKNWARIILLIMVILGTPFVLLAFLMLFTKPFLSLIGIGQTALQIVAVVFLFQKSSSDWFSEQRSTPLSIEIPHQVRIIIGYIVGIVLLLGGIGLGWIWYFLTPEYYRSDLEFYLENLSVIEVIGYLACGLIILTSIELMVWRIGRVSKNLRVLLIASAILLPFAFSFLGMFIGGELSSSDMPMFEMFLGIIIGFGIGAVFSAFIIFIAAREQTQPKEIPFLQGGEV